MTNQPEQTQSDKNSELMELLTQSSADDLSTLVDYLTDAGKGRISMATGTCSKLIAAQARGSYSSDTLSTLSAELCRFGGNSILNLFRGGEGVPYREVVRDVLEHLKGSCDKDEPVESMELKILERMAIEAWKKMDPEQRTAFQAELGLKNVAGSAALAAVLAAIKLGGFASYQIALQVANTMSRMMLGKGLTLAANAGLTRTLAAAAGPIGWVVTGLWTAYDLASPAYRVTVPCVVHIAYMRQKIALNLCAACGKENPAQAKFCNNCGAAMPQGGL